MRADYSYLTTTRVAGAFIGVLFHAAMMFSISGDCFVKFDTRELIIGKIAGIPHIFRMELFFIIAAFLSSSMLEKYGHETFIKKRLIRLVPPFLTGLFLQYLSGLIIKDQPLVEDYPFVQYLWFIPVLLSFAFIHPKNVPVINIQLNKWISVPLLTICISLFCLVFELFFKALGIDNIYLGGSFAHYAPIYIFGIIMWANRRHIDSILSTWPALIPLALFNFSRLSILDDPIVSIFSQTLSAFAFTGIFIAFFKYIVPHTWARPWMNNFSFTLYLLHQPILCLLRMPIMEHFHGSYTRFAILVTATMILCGIAHYLIIKSVALSFIFVGESKKIQFQFFTNRKELA